MQRTVSAWNWKTGRWDYYRAPDGTLGAYGDLPTFASNGQAHAIGETPEESALRMPTGAVLAGSGDHAEGQVVQHPNQSRWTGRSVAIAALLGAILYWGLRRRS